MKAETQVRPDYLQVTPLPVGMSDDAIVERAKTILAGRMRASLAYMDSPSTVRDWLVLHYAALEHEEFGCIFLDARHCIIQAETMFRGTLTQAAVYPREVLKAALACNAASVILYHNHPSGVAEPSDADCTLTKALSDALRYIDVRVLDHFIVAGTSKTFSFSEAGLL